MEENTEEGPKVEEEDEVVEVCEVWPVDVFLELAKAGYLRERGMLIRKSGSIVRGGVHVERQADGVHWRRGRWGVEGEVAALRDEYDEETAHRVHEAVQTKPEFCVQLITSVVVEAAAARGGGALLLQKAHARDAAAAFHHEFVPSQVKAVDFSG